MESLKKPLNTIMMRSVKNPLKWWWCVHMTMMMWSVKNPRKWWSCVHKIVMMISENNSLKTSEYIYVHPTLPLVEARKPKEYEYCWKYCVIDALFEYSIFESKFTLDTCIKLEYRLHGWKYDSDTFPMVFTNLSNSAL